MADTTAISENVIVFYKDFKSHVKQLMKVCQHFRAARLKLRSEKCNLFQKEVQYLEHIVRQHGVAIKPAKVAAVKDWQSPGCTQVVKISGLLPVTTKVFPRPCYGIETTQYPR